MGYDDDKEIFAMFLYKWISVAKMREILQSLRVIDDLVPNAVGNLSIIRDDECIGYIDIGLEELVIYDEPA